MDGPFSNREISIAAWVIGLLVWGATNAGIRKSLIGIGRAFLQRPILIVFGAMVAYVVLMVLVLHRIGLWDVRQIKDTALWAVFVGGASMFRLMSIAKDASYFVETIKDNLKLIVFVEFIVSVFVFSLPLELVIVPVSTFVSFMLVFSERDDKYRSVSKLLNGVMMVFGTGLLVHAIYRIVTNFSGFASIEMLADFSLIPVLTVCFFPFLFLAARVVHHESFAQSLDKAIKEPGLRRYAYSRALMRFRFSVPYMDRWVASLYSRETNTKSDIDRSIDRILLMRSAEKNPPSVPYSNGWSPYVAKDFLKAEGFKTGDYTSYDDREWYALSSQDMDRHSLNSMEYSIEGAREVATKLRLALTVYEEDVLQSHLLRFVRTFKTLYEAAMQSELDDRFEELGGQDHRWIVGNRSISFRKENWKHRAGSELELVIEVI